MHKYEPTAKKHREDEQKATDKALQASKQKPYSNPMRSVGTEPRNPYATPSYDNSYSGGSSWPSYTPSSSSYSPSAASTESTMNNNPFGNSGSRSGAGKQGDGSSASSDKDKDGRKSEVPESNDKKTDGKGKDGKNSQGAGNAGQSQPTKGQPSPDDQAKALSNVLHEIKDNIRNSSEIASQIHKATLTTEPVDADLLTEALPRCIEDLNTATTEIKKLNKVQFAARVKAKEKKELQSEWKIYKSGPLRLKENITQIKTDGIAKLDENHREAFFFTSNPAIKPVELKLSGKPLSVTDIKSIRSVSADDLVTAITNLDTAINDFN